jgi:hypothetical protein
VLHFRSCRKSPQAASPPEFSLAAAHPTFSFRCALRRSWPFLARSRGESLRALQPGNHDGAVSGRSKAGQ